MANVLVICPSRFIPVYLGAVKDIEENSVSEIRYAFREGGDTYENQPPTKSARTMVWPLW